MNSSMKPMLIRLLPVLLGVLMLGAWFHNVEEGGLYVFRNLVPPVTVILLAGMTLYKGRGRWTGCGWRLPLGTVGFAIPAIGLAVYLHYAYSVNLDGLFDQGGGQLFRFLPFYTFFAGGIGFAIGWIIGRNV
jgi:hypothetical protein